MAIFVVMTQRKWYTSDMQNTASNFISIRLAALLFGLSIAGGTGFYHWYEKFTLVDAFYMSVITFATVGYEEVEPLSKEAELFTAFYIILNIGIYAYALTAFSSYVIKGELFKNMQINLVEKKIDKLNDHVIICGFGKYGEEIVHHFAGHKIGFVIIENNREKIDRILHSNEKLLFIHDDATHDEVLIKAGVRRAKALISALPDDADNLFTVLSARQLNNSLSIISRASSPRSEKKLQKAGADHVIMPEVIGGYHIANLVTKPGAVEFFSFITNEYESDIGIEELSFEKMPDSCKHQSIKELNIREKTGTNIIGFKTKEGKYIINPDPTVCIEPGTSFIVLGSADQLTRLKNYLQHYG